MNKRLNLPLENYTELCVDTVSPYLFIFLFLNRSTHPPRRSNQILCFGGWEYQFTKRLT